MIRKPIAQSLGLALLMFVLGHIAASQSGPDWPATFCAAMMLNQLGLFILAGDMSSFWKFNLVALIGTFAATVSIVAFAYLANHVPEFWIAGRHLDLIAGLILSSLMLLPFFGIFLIIFALVRGKEK